MKKILVVGDLFSEIEKIIYRYSEEQEQIEVVKVENGEEASKKLSKKQKFNGIILNFGSSFDFKNSYQEVEYFIRSNEEILYTVPILACSDKKLRINYPQILAYILKGEEKDNHQIYEFLHYI